MSVYATISIDLNSLPDVAVKMHVAKHADGQSTWRIEGDHAPLYLHGTVEDLERFRDSLTTAIEEVSR